MTKKHRVILAVISTAILLICASGLIYASNLKPIEPPKIDHPLNATIIFNLVNKERVKAGLKPLVRDARLDATAQARADDMVARNYFSHNDPMTGENLVNILKTQKQCSGSSENIMNGWGTNTEIVSVWMGSKPHHDAMLKADYTLTGVAVSGDKVVQHFCIAK